MPELQEGQEVQPQPVEEPVGTLEQQVSANAPNPDSWDDDADMPPDDTFTWEASEYVFHEKPVVWYGVLFGLALALGVGLLLVQQWFSIAVVVVMTFAIVMWSKRAPSVLEYHLDSHGISIQGKMFPYAQFKSFSIQHDVAWKSIDLEPAKRLMPRLTLLCETDNIDKIESILVNHLPRHDRDPDLIERITRAIKF